MKRRLRRTRLRGVKRRRLRRRRVFSYCVDVYNIWYGGVDNGKK